MGLSGKDDIKQILRQMDKSVLLDVRSQAEIDASGKLQVEGHRWVQVPVLRGMTDGLVKSSGFLFPDKDTPIVIYCKTDNRASFAKKALEKGLQLHLESGRFRRYC